MIDHNGILSTYYAEAIILPESGYGVVLLTNSHSLAATATAFPEIRRGVIALLLGRQPSTGALSVGRTGLIWGALSLLGVSLAVRSLLGLRRWPARAAAMPLWRLALGVGWTFAPGISLLALPQLIAATTDRVFDLASLFRSMPELYVWLGVCGVLGAANGTLRLVQLVRVRSRARM